MCLGRQCHAVYVKHGFKGFRFVVICFDIVRNGMKLSIAWVIWILFCYFCLFFCLFFCMYWMKDWKTTLYKLSRILLIYRKFCLEWEKKCTHFENSCFVGWEAYQSLWVIKCQSHLCKITVVELFNPLLKVLGDSYLSQEYQFESERNYKN